MTETLGWGDVDVDEEPRRRRISPRVVWATAVLVVAGVVLVPVAQRHLADGAAGWLQKQWLTAQAYDASRGELEQSAAQRVGFGDEHVLVDVVRDLDREEADRLTDIASALGAHHSWSSDVSRTANELRRAITAEAQDLRRDALHAEAPILALGYPPAAISGATQDLLRRADSLVQATARRHHVGRTRLRRTRLVTADKLVAGLQRVTDEPVDAHVLLTSGGTGSVWDLRTGKQLRDVGGPGNVGLTAVGGALLLDTGSGQLLVPPDAGPGAPLPETPIGYAPAGQSGIWELGGDGTAQRFDLSGRRVGVAHPLPERAQAGSLAATSEAIVLEIDDSNLLGSHPVAWFPGSGRQVPIVGTCDDAISTGDHALTFFNCVHQKIEVLDLRSGHPEWIGVPTGFSVAGPIMPSPDGTLVAVELAPQDAPGDNTAAMRLAIGDARSGNMILLPRAASPLQWSRDSSLLLATASDTATTRIVTPLGYWRTGMHDLAAIRIPTQVFDNAFLIAAG